MVPIRIAIVNDSQIRETNPKSRTDDFIITMLKKYLELGLILKDQQVDALFHSGDMFDGPKIDNEISGWFAEIIKQYSCPMYVVPGNHDIFGYTMSNINKTTIGLLNKAGVFNLLTRKSGPIHIDKDGIRVQVEGQEFTPDVDKNPDRYHVSLGNSDYHLLVAHGNVLDKPGPPEMDYLMVDQMPAGADIICTGHYHPGIALTKSKNGPTVINDGSMARDEASVDAKTRIPGVTILVFNDAGIWHKHFIPFKCALPGDQVLDFNTNKQNKAKQNFLNNFRQNLANTSNVQAFDVMKILNTKAATAGNLQKCLDAINAADVLNSQITQKLHGYKDCGYSKRISTIEIENFMSHSSTTIQLDSLVNMFTGPSNAGKTTILRALLWCLFNEPKGTEFIKLGKPRARVKVIYNDGTFIERERTKASGINMFRVHDGKQTHEFPKGFDKLLPIEIANVHQMPPIYLSKDKRLNLSVAEQLDSSFLISESAQTRAQIIGTLAGLDNFDTAIRENAKATAGAAKTIKEKEKITADLTAQLSSYADLPAIEQQIVQAEMGLNVATQVDQDIKELDSMIADDVALKLELTDTATKLQTVQKLDLKEAEKLLLEAEKLEYEITEIRSFEDEGAVLELNLNQTKTELLKIPNLKGVPELLESAAQMDAIILELEGYLKEQGVLEEELKQTALARKKVPTNCAELLNQIEVALGLESEVTDINSLIAEEQSFNNYEVVLKDAMADIVKKSTIATESYVEALKVQKVCPECFATIDDARIHHILQNVAGGHHG